MNRHPINDLARSRSDRRRLLPAVIGGLPRPSFPVSSRLLPVLLVLLGAGASVPAHQAFAAPLPQVGTIRPEVIAAAREAAANETLPTGPGWEDTEKVQAEIEEARLHQDDKLNSDDNDTAHYGRGMTAIIHIFISHDGGTWTATERENQAAKATVAKDYYTGGAPGGANLHFDHEGGTAYYYYNVDYNGTIPYSGMTGAIMETICAQLGRSDTDGDGYIVDDFTLELQDWDGGWDNVIFCFEPDVAGRAFASYSFARCCLYTDDSGNVFAHEWGHLFGSCDEYEEGGHCNSDIDCGPCQSWYLDDVSNNGNCELASCGTNVSCLMINNTFSNVCSYTLNHWGWVDEDSDGILDWTKRRVLGNTFAEIYNVPHGGYALWNNTTDGYAIAQQWNSWCVAGLRSPSTADYDLKMYADNNHNYLLTSSSAGSGVVDFVVGDYNHSRIGNEHLIVNRYSGDTSNYRLGWESGTGALYPDGVVRAGSWNGYNVVRAWDVPLFGGESVTFTLDVTAGSLDLGMALFRSNGAAYYAGRSSAQWIRDAGGVGATESWTFDVPADDVYGLVVFANSAVDGDFTIKLGPTPITLAEETPVASGLDLRLYNYDPNAFYWSIAATRPETGTGATLRLFGDSAYQTELATSNDYSGVELVAADYNPGYSTDYVRVIRTSGAGTHRTEWEHDPDVLSGVEVETWVAGHVGKIWDMYLEAGQTYFFREYHSNSMDTALYLYSSADGNRYRARNEGVDGSNSHPGTDGGEWFSYLATDTDWYGVAMILHDETGGAYSLYGGPQYVFSDDLARTDDHEVVFGMSSLASTSWSVFAERTSVGATGGVLLYNGNSYASADYLGGDGYATGVSFMVVDANSAPIGSYYPMFRRTSASGSLAMEMEAGVDNLVYTPGTMVTADRTWPAGDVADAYDLYIDGGVIGGRDVIVQVEATAGSLDLGMCLFSSQNGDYYQRQSQAVVSADAGGAGVPETFTFHATANDWYGLVVFNNNGNGGSYRVRVYDAAASGVSPTDLATSFDLRTATGNPFRDAAGLEFGLPAATPAELAIFDVRGRRVRTLLDGPAAAGTHRATWDGRDELGQQSPSGIYFARLRSDDGERRVKLIRTQ